MNDAKFADYHVHYRLDHCASDEMTLGNIDGCAREIGLRELAVVKHYSASLPDGSDVKWGNWYRVVPEQFDEFLADVRGYRSPYGTRILAGVETELVSMAGDINIGDAENARLDTVSLSFHWLPYMRSTGELMLDYPGREERYARDGETEKLANVARWREKVSSLDMTAVISELCEGYINAMDRHRVTSLSHMNDGIFQLSRFYFMPVYSLPFSTRIELWEGVMKKAAEKRVLWEITGGLSEDSAPFYRRAAELGVRFCHTVDAHFIRDGWANLTDHFKAVGNYEKFGVPLGRIGYAD